MTASMQHTYIERLREVREGVALVDATSATFGSYVGGADVTIPLVRGERAVPTAVVGATGSGKTTLIESLFAGAQKAGIEVDLADPLHGTAGRVIAEHRELIAARSRDLAMRGVRSAIGALPLRLLLVDHLTEMESDVGDLLAAVVKLAPKAGVAVVVATCSAAISIPGGSSLRENLLLGNLVELRWDMNEISRTFADGSTTVGVGLINGDLFRAWWPGN